MKTEILAQHYNQAVQWRNRILIAAIGLFVINLIQGISIYQLIGRQQTIVVPATFDREFSIGHKVSESYLEQMTQYFASLLLNITPSTFAANSERLLQQVASENFAAVKAQLTEQQQEIQKRGISTAFHIRSYQVNKEALWVELRGDLKILIANAAMESQAKAYRFQYEYQHGRLLLQKFSEVAAS